MQTFLRYLKSFLKCFLLTVFVTVFLMLLIIIDIVDSQAIPIFLVLLSVIIAYFIRLPKTKFVRWYYSFLFILAGLLSSVFYMLSIDLMGISLTFLITGITFITLGVWFLRDRSKPEIQQEDNN